MYIYVLRMYYIVCGKMFMHIYTYRHAREIRTLHPLQWPRNSIEKGAYGTTFAQQVNVCQSYVDCRSKL